MRILHLKLQSRTAVDNTYDFSKNVLFQSRSGGIFGAPAITGSG